MVLFDEFESDNFNLVDYQEETDTALVTLSNFNTSGCIGLIRSISKQFERGIDFAEIVFENCTNVNNQTKTKIQEEKFEENGVVSYLWSQIDSDGLKQNERPVLVLIYGGPHTLGRASYNHFFSTFLSKNFLILTVNFTGKQSYGQKLHTTFTEDIHELRASEIIHRIEELQKSKKLTKNDLNFLGYSYGGYMGLRILHKYPSLFKTITVENPCAVLSTLYYTSDLPGLIPSEFFGDKKQFRYNRKITDKEYHIMNKESISDFEFDANNKTKVLWVLGKQDQTLGFKSNLFLFKKLREIGIKTKCLLFEDEGHTLALDKNLIEVRMNMELMMMM